jgi:hypothetical protein
MKLINILNDYHKDTEKASNIARSVNYSLIAICWIMSKESIEILKDEYKTILLIVLLSLLADFLQYFIKGSMEKCHFDKEEKKAKENGQAGQENYNAEAYPVRIKKTALFFYYSKYVLTGIAALLLFACCFR